MDSRELQSALFAFFQIEKLKYQSKERDLTEQETTAYSNCIQFIDTFLEFNLELKVVNGFPTGVYEKSEYTFD